MIRCFTVYGTIRGQGRPRAFSRGKFTSVYKAKDDKIYESQIASAYINDCGNPEPFGEVALAMSVAVFYEVPKAFSQKKRALALDGKLYPTKKPDLDNVIKSIFDALNGKAYPDDKFIIDLAATQRWAETEKMVVTIREIKGDPV